MKKVIKYLLIVIGGLFLAIILLPFVFQDDLKKAVKQALNESLNAQVEFQDIGLNFWKDFPNAHLSVDRLSITGKDTFEGVPLFNAQEMYLEIRLASLFNSDTPYSIKSLGISETNINLIKINDTLANYLITIPSKDETAYRIDLDEYIVTGGKLSYRDLQTEVEISSSNINHSGSGTFTQSNYVLKTKTQSPDFNFEFAGIPYLYKTTLEANADLEIDLENEKYTFLENEIMINKFPFQLDGYTQFIQNDILIDLKLEAPNSDFAQLYSLIPSTLSKDLESATINGKGEIAAFIKGSYNSVNNQFPTYMLAVNIENGKVKYDRLPHPIDNIQANFKIENKTGNDPDLQVNIPKFQFIIQEDVVRGNLSATGIENPKFEATVKANFDLKKWKQSMPLSAKSSLKGTGKIDLFLDADLASIKNKNYNKIRFSTASKVEELEIQIEDLPSIKASSISFNGNPAALMAKAENLFYKNSDFSFDISLVNPLIALVDRALLEGKISLESRRIVLDSLMTSTASIDTFSSSSPAIIFGRFSVNGNVEEATYQNQVYKFTEFSLQTDQDKIEIREGRTQVNGSNLLVAGSLDNINPYMSESGPVTGNISIKSEEFTVDPWLETDPATGSDSIFILPPNLQINIDASIKTLSYLGLKLNDLKAEAIAGDQSFQIINAESQALGGKLSLQGLYATISRQKPQFDLKFNINDILFQKAFQELRTFQAIAPVAKYINGKLNTTLVMSGSLTDQMLPVWEDLDASGYIETLESAISGYGPLEKISNKIGVSELANWTIGNTKNWFEIRDGMVELKENTYALGQGISLSIGGKHGIGKNMDYDLYLEVPRELLSKNKITATADKGLVFLQNQASKLGVNLEQGENIIIKIDLEGNILSPSLSITPVGTSGDGVDNILEDQISKEKEKVENKIEESKDVLLDTLVKTKDQLVDTLKKSAKNKATSIIDSLKSKNTSKLDSIFTKILSDSTANPVQDGLKEQIKKEENKIKNALEKWNPLKKKKKEQDTTKINF